MAVVKIFVIIPNRCVNLKERSFSPQIYYYLFVMRATSFNSVQTAVIVNLSDMWKEVMVYYDKLGSNISLISILLKMQRTSSNFGAKFHHVFVIPLVKLPQNSSASRKGLNALKNWKNSLSYGENTYQKLAQA